MSGRSRSFAAAALLALAALFLCGWARPAWIKKVDQAGGRRGAWVSAPNEAAWDTVVVVLSTQGIRAAAGDTFQLPASPQGTASPPTLDYARVYEINDYILGRGKKSWRNDNGDTALVRRLGSATGTAGDYAFAYADIDSLRPLGLNGKIASGIEVGAYSLKSAVRNGIRYLNLTSNSYDPADSSSLGRSHHHMFYVPFEQIVPANATIVSAEVIASSSINAYATTADSIIATLMTNPSDDKWYLTKGISNHNDHAKTSWARQRAASWGGTTNAYPWSPELKVRNRPWDWGLVSDWTGSSVLSGASPNYIPQYTKFPINITNCVQSAVSGSENNGVIVQFADASTASAQVKFYLWDRVSNTTVNWRTPVVVIKYITKRYTPQFGTSDLAFAFTTDDFIEGANSAFTDTFNAHGGRYTMFGARIHVDHPSGKQAGMDSLLLWLGEGHEVGTHSYWHKNPAGLTHWEQNRPGKVWDATARAEVYADAKPDWLYALADSATGDSLKSHPQFGKSMALPNNTISMGVQRVLADIGFLSVRGMAVVGNNVISDRNKYPWPPSWATACGDTGMSVTRDAQSRPRNMMLMPYAMTTAPLVGPVSRATAPDSVRQNMRRALFQWRGQGRGEFVTLTHDVKSGHALSSGFGYADGINPDELGAMLDVVDEFGARYMTASDLGRWRRATATAIDTPTGFYNASVDDDSARYYAHEGVWYKPHGVDGRWIPGVRDRMIAQTYDNTPPLAPGGLAAYGLNRSVVLTWAHQGPEAAKYRLYRFFDNAADTVLVADNIASLLYVDTGAVNGSAHNYYVTALDAAGNESQPSATASTTPGTILVLPRPAYYAYWYQDPADGAALSQGDVDKLAAYDLVVGSPHVLEGPQLGEVAFDGLLGRIRQQNPDAIYLTYWTAQCLYGYWADSPSQSAHKRVWEYVASLPDSSGFARDVAGDPVRGDFYPGQMYANVMIPSIADTIAKLVIDAYEGKGTDGEWAGFFLDDSDTTLSNWMCNEFDCGAEVDFDQDGTVYNSDADEKAAFKEWHLRLVKAFRREFAERGMQNRLLVANTTWGRKAVPSPKDQQYMAMLDGAMNEGWNRYWPGPNVPTDTDTWDLALGWRNLHTRAQTSPPLMLWNAHTDSSSQYMNEVAAYAHGGMVNSNSDSDRLGAGAVPTIGRKIAALAPGLSANVTYSDGGAEADTLNVSTGDVRARMVLSRNEGDTGNQYAVWPYLVTTADGTILSRSAFWELPEEVGAPSLVIQLQPGGEGDRQNTLAWEITSGSLPSDFAGWRIYRDPCDGCTDFIYDDNPTVYYSAEFGQAYSWTDTAAANGVEYEYQVAAVDHNGQESDPAASDPMTPYDDTAPAAPQNLVASGGPGYIDLDWSNVTAADLIGYEVSRSFDGGAFAVTDTVTVSAHQDSTALEANEYTYRVRALDDDDNRSAYSGTVTAAWYGDPDPPALPPPSNVMAWPDTPQGRTSVVIYAPADTSGLTGYQVFRGAAADTGSLALYRTGIAVGQFAGAVYEDNKANSDPDTTWYYTAKAMYGDARSEKFHTPRGALTTGNYPSMIPVTSVAGAGALSAIVVAWSQIAGSDSTEIYRGTTAGSQTRIATVAHAANPYYDTGAAANTDYYYKVRYKDNPGTYTAYSAVAGPARWTSVPSGDPSVSGVTGSVSHGSTITISGTNFGTNSTANIYWDNVEGGSFAGFWTDSNGSPDGKIVASASGAGRRHAGSAYHAAADFGSGGGYGSLEYAGTSHTWFCQYWVKLDSNWNWGGAANTPLSNVKFWRMYQTTGNEDFVIALNTFNGSVIIVNENISGYTNTWYHWGDYATEFTENVWHCWQFEYKNSSAAGVADGVFRWWRNGTLAFERTNMVTMEDYSSARYPLIMGFFDSSGASGYDGANTVYFDDFYMSKGWARVEIGNASTYGACTHREIQIPSAWSATSITCTVNAGTLTGSGNYLFVVDEDGVVSDGHPVTIEASKATFDYEKVDYIVGGTSYRIESIQWPTGVVGSMTIRAVDSFSGSVIDEDTSTTGNPSTGPTLTGLVVGNQYRIEYTTSTDDEDYESKATWTRLYGPYIQPARGSEVTGRVEQ